MIDGTPLLRAYAARRLRALARQDAAATQERLLAGLLRRAAATRFGKDHGFPRLRSVAEFQRAVPLRPFEDMARDYFSAAMPELADVSWPGRMTMFAESSGTTSGVTKRFPLSREMLAADRLGALDTLAFHLAARPASRVFGGVSVLLGGSTALTTLAPGVVSGDLSGIVADRAPWWARGRTFPPREIALLGDWNRKMDAMVAAGAGLDVRSLSGTPSWVLMLLDRLAERHPERPRRLSATWPNLELLVHGGVGFAPYRDRIAGWLEGGHAETREVYAASEGFYAAADRGSGEGLRLLLDRGVFFELVPVAELTASAPTRHWVGDAETGVNYAVVVSTNAGLWGHVTGDTVTLVSRSPPRVLITGRTASMLSAFGEHLIAEELDGAVADAARQIGTSVVDFAVGAVFDATAGGAGGGHLFIIEFVPTPDRDSLARFAAAVDDGLAARNLDYGAHRSGMLPPRVLAMPPGGFAAWMASRGRLGGQNKVPRVVQDPAMLADLRDRAGG